MLNLSKFDFLTPFPEWLKANSDWDINKFGILIIRLSPPWLWAQVQLATTCGNQCEPVLIWPHLFKGCQPQTLTQSCGLCGHLVRVLDLEQKVWGLILGSVMEIVPFDKILYTSVFSFTHKYKYVPTWVREVTLRQAGILFWRVEILQVTSRQRNQR